jgi:very-short-patch-repair endonuclease
MAPAQPAERRVTRPIARKVDARCDLRVARLAAEQWGVLSLPDLRACGLNDDAVALRVRRGHLHRLHRGVYAVGHANLPLEGWFLAAVKAGGQGAALSHFAGAAHWGMVEWDGRRIEITVPSEGTRIHAGVRAHRTQMLGPIDLRRRRGIPVTAPARTLIDLASLLDRRPLRRAVRQAQSLRLVNLPQLVAAMDRLGPRRGTARVRRIIATGPAPTRTELEDVLLDLILRGGFEHPDVNVPLILDGRRVVPDFRWPKQRLVVEADGAAWHDHRLAREDDAERQALLEAHGERVLRVTWEQAVVLPTQTLSRLGAARAPRH